MSTGSPIRDESRRQLRRRSPSCLDPDAKKPVASVSAIPTLGTTAVFPADSEPFLDKDSLSRLRQFFELLDGWDREHDSRVDRENTEKDDKSC
jgi:hypothetical protein